MVILPEEPIICPNNECKTILQPDSRMHIYTNLGEDLYETNYPFGGQIYSDGKVGYSKNQYIGVVKCPKCKELFFKNTMTTCLKPKKSYTKLKYVKGARYLDVISKKKSISKTEELTLRLGYWWSENDKWRVKIKDKIVYETFVNEKNLRKLNKLLNTNKLKDMLLSIEIHRQLGEFDKAWDLIGNPDTTFEEFYRKYHVTPKNEFCSLHTKFDVKKYTILFNSLKEFLTTRDVGVKPFPYYNPEGG